MGTSHSRRTLYEIKLLGDYMIKIIIPLSLLKDDMTCYKITGNKPYVVKRRVKVDEQEFICDKSSVFLVDNSGITKSYSSEFEVKFITEELEVIQDLIYGE